MAITANKAFGHIKIPHFLTWFTAQCFVTHYISLTLNIMTSIYQAGGSIIIPHLNWKKLWLRK